MLEEIKKRIDFIDKRDRQKELQTHHLLCLPGGAFDRNYSGED